MVPLTLTVALYLTGFLYALVGILRRPQTMTVPADVRRVLAAIQRASFAVLLRRNRALFIGAGVVASAVVSAHVVFSLFKTPTSRLATGVVASLLVLAGAAATVVLAAAVLRYVPRAALRTLAAASHGLDDCLAEAVRGTGALSLFAEAWGHLVVIVVAALVFVLSPGETALMRGTMTLSLLPYLGLGMALAALLVQHAGLVVDCSARLGGRGAAHTEGGLSPDDPRNPAAVVELVAATTGRVLPRVLDGFVLSAMATIVVGSLARLDLKPATEVVPAALGLALVIRAFGILSTIVGLQVVRTNEAQDPISALWRGELVAVVVALGALVGAAVWLAGPMAISVIVAGIAGVVIPPALGHLTSHLAWSRPQRATDGPRRPPALAWTETAILALRGMVIPTAVLAASWWVAAHLSPPDAGLGSSGTSVLAVMVVASTVLSPFHQTFDLLRSGAILGLRATRIAQRTPGDHVARRVTRVGDAAHRSEHVGALVRQTTGTLVLLLAAVLLRLGPHAMAPNATDFVFALLCVPALAAVLTDVLRATSRATRTLWSEVERQLRVFPREQGRANIPMSFAPSYRSCVDLLAREVVRGGVLSVLLLLLSPMAVSLFLRRFAVSPGLAQEALASFVLAAAIAGFLAGLAVDAVRLAALANRRVVVSSSASAVPPPGDGENGSAEGTGPVVGLSVLLLAKAAGLVALAVIPFLQ